MKIAYVFGSLNPGGSERQTAQIVVRLREKGHDVTVLLPNGSGHMEGNLRPYMVAHGVPMIDCAARPNKLTALIDALRELQPQIVNTNGYPMTLYGTLAAYRVGVPVRVIRYETTGFTRNQFPMDWVFEFAGHRAATHVVANSRAVMAAFPNYIGIDATPARIIPNGVTVPANVTPEMRQQAHGYWSVDDEALIIGHLANFRKDGLKNQIMLVRAMARVVQVYPKARAVLCGYPSPYQDKVGAEIKRLKLRDKVLMPGRLDDLDLLAGWDIAVNTSHTEGLSNAVQECMAYGLPVVATAVDGNLDLIDHERTGLLVGDDDDAALANALIRLIADPDYRRVLGNAGRERMREAYNWDYVLAQWIALYEEGLSNGRTG